MVYADPAAGNADVSPTAQSGRFEIRVSLTGMDPDDVLSIVLPGEFSGVSLAPLLDHIFPPGEEEQRAIASMFDLRANPDLPEIYAVFLDAFDARRNGRCMLAFSVGDGKELNPPGLVSRLLDHQPAGIDDIPGGAPKPSYPLLRIQIDQQYRAVEYAAGMGFWGTKAELLEWLQPLTFLYFLDKHEVKIPAPLPLKVGSRFAAAAADLQSKGLISASPDPRIFVITEEGRGFIGRLLSETESYIDLYDHFKDTSFELEGDTLDLDTVEFGTGRGSDLRVQVFLAEGLDPVRTVFLLRLYDGTLDSFVSSWEQLIEEESFFDGILEPVVNRCQVEEALIGQIGDSGYGFLEERAERLREMESQQEIINRVWA